MTTPTHPAALPSSRTSLWRWLTVAVACATVGDGLASLVFGGPAWPAVVGSVLGCVLGEIYRWRLNVEADRDFYGRYPELWRGWPPLPERRS